MDSHIAIFSSTAVAEGTEEHYDVVLTIQEICIIYYKKLLYNHVNETCKRKEERSKQGHCEKYFKSA